MEIQELEQIGQFADILSVKPNARILDATAGNRLIWMKKESPFILWADIEPQLERKPDIVMDCRKTNFPNNYFNVIIFDPPHGWGEKTGEKFFSCRNEKEARIFVEKWKMKYRGVNYYGMDKYQSKTQLLNYIHRSQLEFYRILKDEGILFMKWCELKIPYGNIKPFFSNWNEMIKLRINDSSQSLGNTQTWWLMLMKKPLGEFEQSELASEGEKALKTVDA